MALDAELMNLKSAGTYRFERDRSEISNNVITIFNLRLITGFSKTGPFNTVKLVNSPGEFVKLYGNIDRSLEKKGSYFHRSALVALSSGPILCLNLLNLDPDLDQVVEKSFSVSACELNNDSVTLPLQTLYNTDKFWYPSDDAFLDAVDKCLGDDSTAAGEWKNSILHFSNVGKKPVSILVKKASAYSSKGYELTLNEWYGEGNVPEYLNGSSYVSDYLVEVYVVGGDFGPALKKNGTIVSSIDLDDDNLDGNGDVLDRFTIDRGESGVESPYKRFSSDIVYQSYFDDRGFIRGIDDANLVKFLNLPSVDLRGKYVGSLIPNFVDKLGRNIWIQKMINDDTDTKGVICVENVDLIEEVRECGDFICEKIDLMGNDIFASVKKSGEDSNGSSKKIDFLSYGFNYDESIFTEFTPKTSTGYKLSGDKDFEVRDNEVILDKESNVVVGDYLVSSYGSTIDGGEQEYHSRLTRVVAVKYVYKNGSKAGILVTCVDKIYKEDNKVYKITPVDKVADRLHWICLNGFQVRKNAIPDGTNDRQNEILDMIRENPRYTSTTSNLFKSLIDRDYVHWRYLVDGFGLGLEEECKNVYTQLCQARKSGLAIINCPSQMDFKKSKDPSFTNKVGGVEAEFIAKGGDLSKNPSYLFSLPIVENGASWGAYYYPYLRITDLSAAKSVPPAAYVSNLYIQKYNRGFAWSIVAGQKRGVIAGNGVVGVEATLIRDNRDWLEPMGINSIIWEQGIGVEVYGNKTAKQTPVSALSSIHVREAAIYIQDGVEDILKRYVWEFNTVQSRLEIKTLVDDFLNAMKNNGGLYDFRTVMDTTNNTAEIIDHNQGVIDIYVEIVRGLEIISQRLTILKTGSIAAGGFE